MKSSGRNNMENTAIMIQKKSKSYSRNIEKNLKKNSHKGSCLILAKLVKNESKKHILAFFV